MKEELQFRFRDRIVDEAVGYARKMICNQAMYQLSTPALYDLWDEWHATVDSVDPQVHEEIAELIRHHPLCNYDDVVRLVADMTLETLYDNDNWVDPIADYIDEHNDKCQELVRLIAKKIGWQHAC